MMIDPKRRMYATYIGHNPIGPAFGSGNDFRLADKCHENDKSYSLLGGSYILPEGYTFRTEPTQTLLAGSYNFMCDEYEVFSV